VQQGYGVKKKSLIVLERMVSSFPMKKNPHAVALGRLGGKRGGPARARRLSIRERASIARQAATTRWHCQGAQDSMRRVRGMFRVRQSRLPKLLSKSFCGPGLLRLRLPRDLEEVALMILPHGTQAQKDLLCRKCGREAVVQIVRRWRGSFLHSESQLLEWVSRGTARRWARENPELRLWSQAR